LTGWRVHFDRLARPHRLRREYVSGEAYRFLGRQCRLKVIESSIERVTRSRSLLMVETRTPQDPVHTGDLVEGWFAHQAERIFATRLDTCLLRLTHWTLDKPKLVIRPMKLRWGSMTPRGTLTLNPRLIQAPTELIDYVILHELCHLREMNHGPAFYALLDQVMPSCSIRSCHPGVNISSGSTPMSSSNHPHFSSRSFCHTLSGALQPTLQSAAASALRKPG